VDGGNDELGPPGEPDRPDRPALRHRLARADEEGAEVCERDGVPVGGSDAECQSVARSRSRERNDACGRRADRCVRDAADVDPTPLPGRVRMRAIEQKGPEHDAVGRP
jgi:hypothetical protein